MHLQLILLSLTVDYIYGQEALFSDEKLCKGICKWQKCGSDCIQRSRCQWNSRRCKVVGRPRCSLPCSSRICLTCKVPQHCGGNIIDVAVVGAGVSGVFSAWKLSQDYDWSIHLFDANDRIGGRVFSVSMPGIEDFKADLGAMRFKPKTHKRLSRLAKELGLTIQPFTTPTKDNTLYYFREELLDKNNIESGNVPYKMTDEEKRLSSDTSALMAYWNNKIIADGSKDLSDPWDKVCVDGKMALEKGNHNAFLEVGSQGAIDYFSFMSGFPGNTDNNVNYVDWSNTDYTPSAGGSPEQLYTIQEGFQQLVVKMAEKFMMKSKNRLFNNYELKSVSHGGAFTNLMFQNRTNKKAVHVCAKQVILGLPAESIKRINFLDDDLSQTLEELLPSVKQAPATKVFLVYDTPWWRHLGRAPAFKRLKRKGIDLKFILTDLPLGQILDIGVDKTSGKAMLLLYNDWWDKIHFWTPYMKNGTKHSSGVPSEFVVTEKLIRQINIQLAKVFNIRENQVPMPNSSLAHAWYTNPYWTAAHSKEPGYHFPTVQEDIIKPLHNRALYIVGEAFSDYQAWVEGALQTADYMLLRYFRIFRLIVDK